MPTMSSRPRSDPFIFSLATLFAGVLTTAALAQENPTGGPNALARTVADAVVAAEVPDQAPTPPRPEDARPITEPEGLFGEPRFLTRAINFGARTSGEGGGLKSGFYPEFSNMVTGSGWISVGPGYRQWLFNDRAVIEGSTAISWRAYKMAQARFELTKLARSRVAVGSQLLWQDATQISYFGIGPDSLDESRSEYRMKTTNVVGYTTVRPVQWLSLGGRLGWLERPTILAPAGSFKRGNPDAADVFPTDAVFSLAEQPNYIHGDLSVTADTRSSRSHPASGGVYRASAAMYSDRDAGMFSFRRYEAEAAQFVPVAENRIVFAAHGWIVGSETDAGQVIPFYVMPALGGNNTLRDYTDYRFHDRNLLLVSAEARVALVRHIDVAVFADAGNVAARFADLTLDKRSYGVGLRVHTPTATFARVDVAHGTEGWRFLFRTSDPFHLTRLARRTATAPFVP
jgi:hypothetical protein